MDGGKQGQSAWIIHLGKVQYSPSCHPFIPYKWQFHLTEAYTMFALSACGLMSQHKLVQNGQTSLHSWSPAMASTSIMKHMFGFFTIYSYPASTKNLLFLQTLGIIIAFRFAMAQTALLLICLGLICLFVVCGVNKLLMKSQEKSCMVLTGKLW